MGIIDAHHHVWDLSVRAQPWLDGPELAPIRRSFSVAAAGLCYDLIVRPYQLPAAAYATVVTLARSLTAKLSEAERTVVFASTAARVYALGCL